MLYPKNIARLPYSELFPCSRVTSLEIVTNTLLELMFSVLPSFKTVVGGTLKCI
jgi:hypothetical protein